MEKLKGKLVARSHPRRHGSVDLVPDRTSSTSDEEADDDGTLRIVKTKQFAMKPMTPEEAALQMDLLGHDFYFFSNAETSRAAVVYRRGDGFIGLIDAT
jgi:putative sigma-54 modulation protein